MMTSLLYLALELAPQNKIKTFPPREPLSFYNKPVRNCRGANSPRNQKSLKMAVNSPHTPRSYVGVRVAPVLHSFKQEIWAARASTEK